MVLQEKETYAEIMWQLYQRGDWRRALDSHWDGREAGRGLLWARPWLCDLEWVAASVGILGHKKIVSIGCGSGLLEWLLQSATGMQVRGVEVDKNYWTQPCWDKRKFVDLVFKGDDNFAELTQCKENALMFCYFNNRKAFRDYINNYRGNCVVIIGPHNAGRFTDPGPFDKEFQDSGWEVFSSKEIADSKDFIVIYKRNSHETLPLDTGV